MFWWATSINTNLPCSSHSAKSHSASLLELQSVFSFNTSYILPSSQWGSRERPTWLQKERVTERETCVTQSGIPCIIAKQSSVLVYFLHVYLYLLATCETYQWLSVIFCCWVLPKADFVLGVYAQTCLLTVRFNQSQITQILPTFHSLSWSWPDKFRGVKYSVNTVHVLWHSQIFICKFLFSLFGALYFLAHF